jgi:hypothetical protein
LETEVKRLYDDVVTLRTAIEEAIIKRQKSLAGLTDIRRSILVCHEDFVLTRRNPDSGVVGWVDDF